MLERLFDLRARGTTAGRELGGAIATMAYILVANPAILSAAGVPLEAAVAATALAAGLCSILMGITANFPLALAPGMGLNAVVARIDFTEPDTAIPAFLILLMVPLTYSISYGIGAGFIAFVAIKLLSGRVRDVHPLMAASAAAFAIYFASSRGQI